MKVSLFHRLNITIWLLFRRLTWKSRYSAGWTISFRRLKWKSRYSADWTWQSRYRIIPQADMKVSLFYRLNMTISLLFRRLTCKSRYSADWTWHSGRSPKFCRAQSVKARLAASSLASSRELLTTETFKAQKWHNDLNFVRRLGPMKYLRSF